MAQQKSAQGRFFVAGWPRWSGVQCQIEVAAVKPAGCVRVPGGMPVGWIQPIFQDTRTQMKRTIEKPTRKAKAVAMLPFLGAWPSAGGALPRIMYIRAAPRLNKMATKAMATRIFMDTLSND